MLQINFQKSLHTTEGVLDLKINLELAHNQLIAVFGKSGVGKTTFLRILAGLTQVEQGFLKVNEVIWLDSTKKINLPPQKRPIGMVFQDYALFPNMTVRQNLLFALSNPQKQDFIAELLEITELQNLAERKPAQLSGGQQQRLALARALVRQPEVLLLDEPLSALDEEIRLKLRVLLQTIQAKFQTTTFLVSHDLSEIMQLADYVLVIEQGQITQQGKPQEIFEVKGQQEIWGLRSN